MSTAFVQNKKIDTANGHSPSAITYTEELITPELAAYYLSLNIHNRAPKPLRIRAYAADMLEGRWMLNGEGIKLTKSNQLADGQNRLLAVVLIGIAVRMTVIRGVDDVAQETMDTGANRTLPDSLKLRGEVRNPSLAAVIRSLYIWDHWPEGTRRLVGSDIGANPVMTSNSILLKYFDADPENIRRITVLCDRYRKGTRIPASILAPLIREMENIDPQDAVDFFMRLQKGLPSESNFGAADPIVVLNRGLQRLLAFSGGGHRGRYSSSEMAAYIVKGWNAYRLGTSIRILKYRSGGSAPEPFPEMI